MAKLELMANEVVVRETQAQHFRRKWHIVVRTLTLTNQRLILRTSGLDPISDGLRLRDLFAALLGKSPFKGKPIMEVRLDELAAITRSKFGLNNRVLLLQTRNGLEHRIAVDDFEAWIETICERVNATGVVQMVEATPNRWVVERRLGCSS